MPTYTLLSGEVLEYPEPPPAVAAFLAELVIAANDPAVSVPQLIEAIYGLRNPIMDTAFVPGRAMVTKAVFANPVYHVMADLIGRKQVQIGQLDLAATADAYSVSVPDAARRLGITAASVRAAINARKLAAWRKNGQWWVRPESIASYKVGTRGRKRAAAPAVVARVGSEPGASLSLRVAGGQLVREREEGEQVVGRLPAGWTRAVVRTTGRAGARAFVIEPAAEPGEIAHGGLYVRGPFKVVERINNPTAAKAAWASLAAVR
jgi:hypothetical protein